MIATNGTPQMKSPEKCSLPLRDFLKQSLAVDMTVRASSAQLRGHPFFASAAPRGELAAQLKKIAHK